MEVVTEYRWERIPTVTAERARITREKREARQARYESSERARNTRHRYEESHRKRSTERGFRQRKDKPFVVWDGEQPRDTGYSLFGNSEGMEICHPHLSTKECLELIIETELEIPDAIHVGFGFNLDVSWILKDLPWRALNRLKRYNRCFWNGYHLEHIPHKWFAVKWGTVNAKIFDVHSFFQGKLTDALEDWRIGPWANERKTNGKAIDSRVSSADESSLSSYPTIQRPSQSLSRSVPSSESVRTMSERELVETFKWVRSEFMWKDIDSIAVYMRLELKYTRQLMKALREAMLAAGYLPQSWHGPGALATMALRRHHVSKAMAATPPEVQRASRCAFFGGRFSQHICGHIQRPVYFADRNSAYPYACTFLPNLARGHWRLETAPDRIRESVLSGKFAVYRIIYHYRAVGWTDGIPGFQDRNQSYRIFPLPKRTATGSIEFGPRVTGWYWTPEARLVIDDKSATFVAAWIFDEDDETDRPFAWIAEYYRRRQILKKTGQASEKTFKLILNAIFGQCARRTGWDRKNHRAPRSHQLEWAGYITSHCRAALYEMAIKSGEENVVSIDTDGLLSLGPIPVDRNGDGLGEWKTDTYDEAIVWQSGMYALRKGSEWDKAKTRGIARAAYTPDDLVRAVTEGVTTLRLRQNKFIGYGLALNGQHDRNNTWIEEPYEFVMGGSGTRYHDEKRCKTRCDGTIHRVRLDTFQFLRMDTDPESVPHFLPWLDNSAEMLERMGRIDDLMLFDMWDTEEWRPDNVYEAS